MAGSLVALDKITEKDDSGANSDWMKSLLVDDMPSVRFRDLGIVAGIVFVGLVIISGCGLCLKMKGKKELKLEGEWRWERKTENKDEGEKQADRIDDQEMEDMETTV